MEFEQWTKVEPCEMENDVDIRNDLEKQSWLGEMGGKTQGDGNTHADKHTRTKLW